LYVDIAAADVFVVLVEQAEPAELLGGLLVLLHQ